MTGLLAGQGWNLAMVVAFVVGWLALTLLRRFGFSASSAP
jgi:hypothetical protein